MNKITLKLNASKLIGISFSPMEARLLKQLADAAYASPLDRQYYQLFVTHLQYRADKERILGPISLINFFDEFIKMPLRMTSSIEEVYVEVRSVHTEDFTITIAEYDHIICMRRMGRFIDVVKFIRSQYGIDLKTAKDICDAASAHHDDPNGESRPV